MPLLGFAPLETAPAVFEIGVVLLLAVGAGWLARRPGLPAVLVVLASLVLGRELIPSTLFNAVLAAVVVTIAVATTLVKLGTRPVPAQAASSG